MDRQVITVIFKRLGEAAVLTLGIGLLIGILGFWKKWDASVTYSNAFFLAACLMVIGGTASRFAAGGEWSMSRRMSSESFRDLSPADRANRIVELSSSFHLVIVGLVSGVLLALISVLIMQF